MTWPTTPVNTADMDNGLDSPAAARAAIKDMADKVNDMIATPPVTGYPGRLLAITVYDTAGSFTHTFNTSCTGAIIEGVSGGGGSAYAAAGASGYDYAPPGGGGGYAKGWLASPPATATVEVGAGGLGGTSGSSSGGPGGATRVIAPGGAFIMSIGGGAGTTSPGNVPTLDLTLPGGLGGTLISNTFTQLLESQPGTTPFQFIHDGLQNLLPGHSKYSTPNYVAAVNNGFGGGGLGRIRGPGVHSALDGDPGFRGKVIVYEFGG